MRDITKTTFKTLGTALCAGLIAITAIPSTSQADDGHWRYGRDRYGNRDREWVDHDRGHRHHRHYSPRVVERPIVVERPVYVMPQPIYQMPVQDSGFSLNFTIPLR